MPYRQPVFLFFALLLALAQSSAWAQTVPPMLPYTGTIAVKDAPPFNSNGQFKFAIVSSECQATPPTGCVAYWSNDLSKSDGSEPAAGVTIPVTNGVFAVKLGDKNLTNMQEIPPTVFDNATTFLRVWFSDNGTTFEQLSPDRQLVSVPYAFRADVANSVTGAGSIGSTQIDSTQVQRRVTETCAVGSSIQSVNSDGTVVCETDDVGITSETDPQVGSLAVSQVPRWDGAALVNGLLFDNGTNVGIGTTSPQTTYGTNLTVSDTASAGLELQGSAPNTNGVLGGLDFHNGSSRQVALQAFNDGGSTISGFNIYTSNSGLVNTLAMTIKGSGNVGIGATSPGAKLEVKAGSEGQTAPVTALKIWGPNTPADSRSAQDLQWGFASAGSSKIRAYRGGSWDTYLQFLTNASAQGADNPQVRLHINHDGNVGIGTTIPSEKLHVAGNFIRVDGKGGEQAYIGGDGAGSDVQLGSFNSAVTNVALWNETTKTRMDLFVKNLNATGAKNFVQAHPTDPTKEIVYTALEGPEAGTYIRGTSQLLNGEAVIDLPEHFGLVTVKDGLTVQLTLLEECNGLFVVEKSPRRIVVRELMKGTSSAHFDYLVQGIRAGYENQVVVREKTSALP